MRLFIFQKNLEKGQQNKKIAIQFEAKKKKKPNRVIGKNNDSWEDLGR